MIDVKGVTKYYENHRRIKGKIKKKIIRLKLGISHMIIDIIVVVLPNSNM